MMPLFGTEQWSAKHLDAEISFELAFAQEAPSLLKLVATADRDGLPVESRPRISESIFALTRAAELAFASGNIEDGRAICMKIVTEQSSPLTPMQLALYATVGALMGALDVHLDAKGARVDRHSARPIFLPWPVDSPFATLLSRHFLVAAAASGTLFKEPNDFFNLQDSGLKPQALAALRASPEFRAVMNVGSESDSGYAGQQAIESMEFSYLTRLLLMQRDAYHWKSMQPRGSIIDWPLLCIWTAHLRSSKSDVKVLETAPANAAGRFIRELAAELSRQH